MISFQRLSAVIYKEWKILFGTSLGFTILLLFMFLENLFFFYGAGPSSFWDRRSSDITFFFQYTSYMLLIFIPTIGMRVWAEEREMGTIELIFTLPLATWEIVLGKYVAFLAFLFIALLSTVMVPITTFVFGRPDFGLILSGYFGIFLLGATNLAIVFFISLFFQTQIASMVFSFFLLFTLYFFGIQKFTDLIGIEQFSSLQSISLQRHVETFLLGILDFYDFYFFISVSGLFLFFTYWKLRERN